MTIQHLSAKCLFEAKSVLAEGPGWDEKRQEILWIDIEVGKICRLNPSTQANQVWTLPTKVGCVVNSAKGDFIAGTQQGLVRVNPANGQMTPLSHPESQVPDNRFNDGKCDPRGRLWAGTMSCLETPGAGNLYRLDPDLKLHKMRENVTISNGLAWSGDGKTMYYIDTPTLQVDAYDYDLETGNISRPRSVIRIPEGMGYPDGMTIDQEGMLWIALWAGWGVTRWNPNTGELLAKIDLPVEKVTACCFGGKDFQDLYITTASRDLTEEALKQQPLAGSLFVAKPGVAGYPTPVFQG